MISSTLRQTIEKIGPLLDRGVAAELSRHWEHLPKPPGSLGRLEDMVLHYGLVRGTAAPTLERKGLYVFCADHGIAAEGVSRDAQDATHERMRQFLGGGSASRVLCRQARIEPLLVNAGVRGPEEPGALNFKIADGSANSSKGPALTEEQANAALDLGVRLAGEAASRFDVVGIGQIGVGCSASASAMLSSMTGRDASETAGREAGLDDAALQRKVQAIRAALIKNQQETIHPLGVLRSLGGLDIAAMTGFLLGAASRHLPVVIDGFNAGAAAMAARAFAPDALDVCMFASQEPERAHGLMLKFLCVEPQFDLRLQEDAGFAAALCLQLLDAAVALYAGIRPAPQS